MPSSTQRRRRLCGVSGVSLPNSVHGQVRGSTSTSRWSVLDVAAVVGRPDLDRSGPSRSASRPRVQLARPVAVFHVWPPSTETSTAPTTPPPVSERVLAMVTTWLPLTDAPLALGEVIVTVGGVLSVDLPWRPRGCSGGSRPPGAEIGEDVQGRLLDLARMAGVRPSPSCSAVEAPGPLDRCWRRRRGAARGPVEGAVSLLVADRGDVGAPVGEVLRRRGVRGPDISAPGPGGWNPLSGVSSNPQPGCWPRRVVCLARCPGWPPRCCARSASSRCFPWHGDRLAGERLHLEPRARAGAPGSSSPSAGGLKRGSRQVPVHVAVGVDLGVRPGSPCR